MRRAIGSATIDRNEVGAIDPALSRPCDVCSMPRPLLNRIHRPHPAPPSTHTSTSTCVCAGTDQRSPGLVGYFGRVPCTKQRIDRRAAAPRPVCLRARGSRVWVTDCAHARMCVSTAMGWRRVCVCTMWGGVCGCVLAHVCPCTSWEIRRHSCAYIHIHIYTHSRTQVQAGVIRVGRGATAARTTDPATPLRPQTQEPEPKPKPGITVVERALCY